MHSIHRQTVFALVLALAGAGCASSGGPVLTQRDARIALAKRNVGIDYLGIIRMHPKGSAGCAPSVCS